jgi:hypothetical protein
MEQLGSKLEAAGEDTGIGSTADLVESSPELAEAQQAWAACMDDAGFEVKSVDDPKEQLSKRTEEIIFAAFDDPEPDLGAVTTASPSTASPSTASPSTVSPSGDSATGGDPQVGDGSDVVAGGDEDESPAGAATTREQAFNPADVDLAALRKLQAEELEMAQADRDCQAEFFRPTYIEVRRDAEQKFVDRNGELLDELAQLTGLGEE